MSRARLTLLLALGGLSVVFASTFYFVRPTNFGGYDEWLYLSLNSRWVLPFPHANRPLTFIWCLPAVVLLPHGFLGYHLLHQVWLLLTGWTTFLLARRLTPQQPLLAFLAGCFAIVWAPSDLARLSSTQMCLNSGAAFGTFLSLLLLVEAFARGSWRIGLLAAAAAFVAVRSHEAGLALVVVAPFLLPFVPDPLRPEDRRRLLRWAGAWEGLAALLTGLVFLPWLVPSGAASYQASLLGLDPTPLHVLSRLAAQFRYHLLPVLGTGAPMARPAVAAAAVVFALAFLALAWHLPRPGREWRRPAALAALGLVLAGAGYAAFVFSGRIQGANRTEFLAAPGIGLFLAATAHLLAGRLPAAARLGALLLFGGWLVVQGTAQTVAMQHAWNTISVFEPQVESLRQLVRIAPDLKPNTLVVLLQDPPARTWRASFSFRHAVDYLYAGHAVGHVQGVLNPLYPIEFTPEGVLVEPIRPVRTSWSMPPTRHRYDEIVALRLRRSGQLELLETWPADLPPLPDGARYAPHDRIRSGPPRPEWAALADPRVLPWWRASPTR